MKKKLIPIVIVTIGIAFLLSGCAQANQYVNTPVGTGTPAGFLQGLIQGFIIVFAFVFSLFHHTVGIYEVHNDGTAYNVGFVIGLWIFFGGVMGAFFRSKSRRS